MINLKYILSSSALELRRKVSRCQAPRACGSQPVTSPAVVLGTWPPATGALPLRGRSAFLADEGPDQGLPEPLFALVPPPVPTAT